MNPLTSALVIGGGRLSERLPAFPDAGDGPRPPAGHLPSRGHRAAAQGGSPGALQRGHPPPSRGNRGITRTCRCPAREALAQPRTTPGGSGHHLRHGAPAAPRGPRCGHAASPRPSALPALPRQSGGPLPCTPRAAGTARSSLRAPFPAGFGLGLPQSCKAGEPSCWPAKANLPRRPPSPATPSRAGFENKCKSSRLLRSASRATFIMRKNADGCSTGPAQPSSALQGFRVFRVCLIT